METSILSAKGRIARAAYWTRALIASVISYIGTAIFTGEAALLGLIIAILCSVFSIIQGVKRMHDVDKSGWYLLIPVYNFVLAVTDGTPGENSYGKDPKGRVSSALSNSQIQ